MKFANEADTQAEIERVRAGGVVGESGRVRDLFDFLAEQSAKGVSPKHADIGKAVFWKGPNPAPDDDSVVRVYVHRLRKRLEMHYLRTGARKGVELTIPRGGYKLVGVHHKGAPGRANDAALGAEDIEDDVADAGFWQRVPRWAYALAIAIVLVGINLAVLTLSGPQPQTNPFERSQFWADMLKSERPLTVVVGDYYVFGEYENRTSLKRFIHDPLVSSKDEMVQRYMGRSSDFDKYADISTQYLPSSAASVLADLAPLLNSRKPVHVVLASQLTSDRLKTDDVIYVGLLSGLGVLRERVFARSRFVLDPSFDIITDQVTAQTYISEAKLAAPSDTMYRDYGYLATFQGFSGNRILILSGTQDTALLGLSQALSRSQTLTDLDQHAKGADSFEALFEVTGQKNASLQSRALVFHPLGSEQLWETVPK